jgi:hypothetical protein
VSSNSTLRPNKKVRAKSDLGPDRDRLAEAGEVGRAARAVKKIKSGKDLIGGESVVRIVELERGDFKLMQRRGREEWEAKQGTQLAEPMEEVSQSLICNFVKFSWK